jgi:hypothetical protein
MTDLRFRQVHLDFHTSERIPGIGSEFDADEFADTLKAAHVNSVTSFSRCHHGMLYHDTALFPERRHPGLTCNLLPLQIEACHRRDIRVPIYITVRWDYLTAQQHPEWLCQDENGRITGTPPYEAGFYRNLCINSPFVGFLEAQTAEVCETMPVDGVFFDICFPVECSCQNCLTGMIADGLNPSLHGDRMAYAIKVLVQFEARLYDCVHSRQPEATVFFNSGHVGPHHRERVANYTHLELESLPSGGWGYMHFPVTQRFARGMGLPTMGMTGRFHTSWGDFQSFKNPAALEFECLTMLSLGARCSIGDQLHPRGRLCSATYDLIGGAYAKVEAAEPWCVGAEPLSDIALMTPEGFALRGHSIAMPPAAIGATRMLQETHHQFDIVDAVSDLSAYRVVILPDEIPVDEALAAKLSAFVADGGALIVSHRSGLTPAGDAFALPELGVELVGDAPYSPDFIVPGALGQGLPDVAHVMYARGTHVRPTVDAEVLCPVQQPYFNRTWEHFCSHQHTPADRLAEYPGAVRKGGCIYLMHPIFSMYEDRAPRWCRQLLANALDLLMPEPLVRVSAPSAAQVTVNAQPAESRVVVHLLHYIPERRGRSFDTIEDIVPITDVHVSLRQDAAVRGVQLVPQRVPLPFGQEGERVAFTVPWLEGHQMIEVDLGA